MITVRYAVQTCDLESPHHKSPRFCNAPKSEVTKRCIRSFLQSVDYAVKRNDQAKHEITIFDDRSSLATRQALDAYARQYSNDLISVCIKPTDKPGLTESIRECYNHMRQGGDLVYQVQDDYLFDHLSVYQTINMYFQLVAQTQSEAFVSPYNDPYYWLTSYHNRSTPRMIVMGNDRYWIQLYDISCSFLTSRNQFNRHWDLYNKFFDLIDSGDDGLERHSLNKIPTERNVLAVAPVNTLAFHLQSDLERDPYIDWTPLWNTVSTT